MPPLVAWLAWAALADEPPPPCPELTEPAETVSVAWVSPLGRAVGGRGWVDVVPTTALMDAVAAEDAGVGRMLQLLGERKKADDPKRRYKVTIFEVRAVDLCRPIDDPEGRVAAGVAICEAPGRAARLSDGCGVTTDRADGGEGLPLYRIQWRDAAVRGFCVLPADRVVEEAR